MASRPTAPKAQMITSANSPSAWSDIDDPSSIHTYDLSGKHDCWIIAVLSLFSCGLPCFGWVLAEEVKLTLEAEEVVVSQVSCCENKLRRIPYGELGSVEETRCCCGWVGLTLGRTMFPGWGYEEALVAEVVGRLKARQRLRGDTGQIIRSEHNAEMLQELNEKLDCIMRHLKITYRT